MSADDDSVLPSRFELTAGGLTAVVLAHGAELRALRKDGVPYLYEADAPGFWPKSAPILFPAVGRSSGDVWCVEGRDYPMPRHGFARDLLWDAERGADDFVELTLSDGPATRKHFPYAFLLTAEYRLTPESLVCTYRLQNDDDRALPFSFGLHPAFRLPTKPDGSPAPARVRFPKKMRAERVLLEDGYRTKKRELVMKNTEFLPLSSELFSRDAIVLRNPEVEELTLEAEGSPRSVRVAFTPCTWLGVWSQPGAPFVCLEPWRGVAAKIGDTPDVESKDAIEWLPPAETFEYRMTITPT
jgi:galactose mutarotase-like enzyme